MGVPDRIDTLGQWGRDDLSMQRRLAEGRLLDRGSSLDRSRDFLECHPSIQSDGNGGILLKLALGGGSFARIRFDENTGREMARQLALYYLAGQDKVYL